MMSMATKIGAQWSRLKSCPVYLIPAELASGGSERETPLYVLIFTVFRYVKG